MTEAKWRTCIDPESMLEHIGDRASDRKLRLFACACCRRIWPHLQEKGSKKVVEVSEDYADGRATRRKLQSAAEKADDIAQGIHLGGGGTDEIPAQAAACLGVDLEVNYAAELAAEALGAIARGEAYERIWQTPGKETTARWAEDDAVRRAAEAREQQAQAALLREILGNPFRPITPDPAWRTATVVSLAQAAYEERILPSGELEPARLAVLADAAEEAGCTKEALLSHLRSAGPHVRGCWALDLILGKE